MQEKPQLVNPNVSHTYNSQFIIQLETLILNLHGTSDFTKHKQIYVLMLQKNIYEM